MNLLEILDSPKSYSELLSVIGDQSALDITLSIHRKQGKIKLNEQGKWEIPKPPCMVEEPLRPTITKQRISIAKRRRAKPNETHRMCDRCGLEKGIDCFPRNGNGYREYRCYTCVAVRHRELRAEKRAAKLQEGG